MAKPSIKQPDRAQQVEDVIGLIETGLSESAACKKAGINRATFRAAALRVGAGDSYARALESLAADQVEKVELAIDDMRGGRIDPQMARVEIDARKWFASKFLPKRYGDRLATELSVVPVETTDQAVIMAEIRELLAADPELRALLT